MPTEPGVRAAARLRAQGGGGEGAHTGSCRNSRIQEQVRLASHWQALPSGRSQGPRSGRGGSRHSLNLHLWFPLPERPRVSQAQTLSEGNFVQGRVRRSGWTSQEEPGRAFQRWVSSHLGGHSPPESLLGAAHRAPRGPRTWGGHAAPRVPGTGRRDRGEWMHLTFNTCIPGPKGKAPWSHRASGTALHTRHAPHTATSPHTGDQGRPSQSPRSAPGREFSVTRAVTEAWNYPAHGCIWVFLQM